MKKYLLIYLIVLSSLVSFTSCDGFLDHFRDKENISELAIDLESFDSLYIKDVFDVYLVQDSVNFVEIVGDEEIIKEVEAKVEDNALQFTNNYSVKWLKPKTNDVELYIHFINLAKIKVSETSFVKTLNPIVCDEIGVVFEGKLAEGDLELDCNTFYYWNNHPCGGKLILSGNAKQLKLWNFALTEIDARNLDTPYALVDNHSQSHCWVKPTSKLEYSISGAGNIYYYGNPEIIETEEPTGEGKLIKLN